MRRQVQISYGTRTYHGWFGVVRAYARWLWDFPVPLEVVALIVMVGIMIILLIAGHAR